MRKFCRGRRMGAEKILWSRLVKGENMLRMWQRKKARRSIGCTIHCPSWTEIRNCFPKKTGELWAEGQRRRRRIGKGNEESRPTPTEGNRRKKTLVSPKVEVWEAHRRFLALRRHRWLSVGRIRQVGRVRLVGAAGSRRGDEPDVRAVRNGGCRTWGTAHHLQSWVDGLLAAFFRKLSVPPRLMLTTNKIIDGLWRGEMKCIDPKAKDGRFVDFSSGHNFHTLHASTTSHVATLLFLCSCVILFVVITNLYMSKNCTPCSVSASLGRTRHTVPWPTTTSKHMQPSTGKPVTRFHRNLKKGHGSSIRSPVARSSRMVGGLHKKSSGRKECQHHGTHPQAILVEQIRNLQEKWNRGKHSFFVTSRRTEISRSARGPKISRAHNRKGTGDAVSRAENFGDLITADHKVLSEGCGSRNSHRYAVVVQDLATQWIQSCPCKSKTCQWTDRNLRKFFDPSEKPRVIYTDNSLEIGKSCEDLSWNQCTSTPHWSETNGNFWESGTQNWGTSAALLQSGLNEKWSADSLECYCCLRTVQDLLLDGNTLYQRRFTEPFNWPVIPSFSMIEYHHISAADQSRFHQFGKKVLLGIFSRICTICVENAERKYFDRRLGVAGTLGGVRNPCSETQCEGCHQDEKWWKIHVPDRRWNRKIVWWQQVFRKSTMRRVHKMTFEENRTGLIQKTCGWQWTLQQFRSIEGNHIYRHHGEPGV